MVRLEEDGLLENGERMQLVGAFLDRQEGIRALELLRHLKDRDPLPKEEGLLLAAAYEMTGKRDQAMAVYATLARSHQDDPALLAELGDRALWLNRYSAALTFYEAALKRDPKNLRALKGSAQIYAWNNDPKTAMARFEAYNRLNPDDFEVRYQLGELYFADQRPGPALKEYQKAMTLMDRMKRDVNSPQPSPRNTRTRQ
jgi:tetratricopeptide (TPR) repeat protein